MIKLTIQRDTDRERRTFTKRSITIGAIESPDADIKLREETLKDVHVKIIDDHGRLFCQNVANDPFVTLNDIPFGKRELKEGDVLQIGETAIHVGHESDPVEELALDDEPEEDIPIKALAPEQALPDSEEQQSSFEDLDIEELVKEVELMDWDEQDKEEDEVEFAQDEIPLPENDFNLDELAWNEEELTEEEAEDEEPSPSHHEALPVSAEPEESSPSQPEELPVSLDDEHLPEAADPEPTTQSPSKEKKVTVVDLPDNEDDAPYFFDEEEEHADDEDTQATIPVRRRKRSKLSAGKVWLALGICIISTLAFISSGVYHRLQNRAQREEIAAARSIADVGMALTYAKINNIKPQQQNWTDPSFLKQSIASVLSPYHEPLASVDNHGRMNNSHYLLRIYTNRDLSRFLIIAQPEASLMQWLAPQKAIVLDSLSMELRSIEDLRPLNRLLVNFNSLSGESGKEVFELLSKEKLIPLAMLGDKSHKYGFEPPKGLELLKVGAHNYIYNAPRYSQVGDRLMQEAVNLASRPGSTTEVKKLQEQLNMISRLPYAVMYTSNGMRVALKAQKALATLLPDQKFLIAYIQSDDAGMMKGSHLILDSDHQQTAAYPFMQSSSLQRKEVGSYQPLVIAAKAPDYLNESGAQEEKTPKAFSKAVDRNSTLYLEIQTLANQRKEALQPISAEMIELIKKNNDDQVPDFSEKLKALVGQYENLAKKQEQETFATLKALYDEHDSMPLSEFSKYVKAAGLSGVATSQLKEMVEEHKDNILSEEEFQEQLDDLQNAYTLHELNEKSKAFHQELRIDNIPESKRLANYQNRVRSKVLERLNNLLFSPDSKLSQYELHPGNRKVLLDILTASWVADPEERNFYLSEFDLLVDEKLYHSPTQSE